MGLGVVWLWEGGVLGSMEGSRFRQETFLEREGPLEKGGDACEEFCLRDREAPGNLPALKLSFSEKKNGDGIEGLCAVTFVKD